LKYKGEPLVFAVQGQGSEIVFGLKKAFPIGQSVAPRSCPIQPYFAISYSLTARAIGHKVCISATTVVNGSFMCAEVYLAITRFSY
jgi:hypothetical protein